MVHPITARSGESIANLADVIAAVTARGLRVDVFTASGSWLANAETVRIELDIPRGGNPGSSAQLGTIGGDQAEQKRT